jgi:hypothetical protein
MEDENKYQANPRWQRSKGARLSPPIQRKTTVRKSGVEVHTCYSIELSEPRPIVCACRKIVSIHVAKKLVKEGSAEWVVGYDRPKPYHDGGKICMVGRSKCTPRGATIEKAHIERAYVKGDLEEQIRINEYGKMSIEVITALIKQVPADKFDAHFKAQWGRPAFSGMMAFDGVVEIQQLVSEQSILNLQFDKGYAELKIN